MAADLVLLGEGRHADAHGLALLLVALAAVASDCQGVAGTRGSHCILQLQEQPFLPKQSVTDRPQTNYRPRPRRN